LQSKIHKIKDELKETTTKIPRNCANKKLVMRMSVSIQKLHNYYNARAREGVSREKERRLVKRGGNSEAGLRQKRSGFADRGSMSAGLFFSSLG